MFPDDVVGEKCACGHAVTHHRPADPAKPCGFCGAVSEMILAGTAKVDGDGLMVWVEPKPTVDCTCRDSCRFCGCSRLVIA